MTAPPDYVRKPSGCACIIDDATGEITRWCDLHAEWQKRAETAESSLAAALERERVLREDGPMGYFGISDEEGVAQLTTMRFALAIANKVIDANESTFAALRADAEDLQEALVCVAFGMHATDKYMVMAGLSLIDNDRVRFRLKSGKIIAAIAKGGAG